MSLPFNNKISYSIHPANWLDFNVLRQLEKKCFPKDHWPIIDIIGILIFSDVIRLKAVANEQMIGFIAGEKRNSGNVGWIATVCVLPEYQGNGIGSSLILSCEKQLGTSLVKLNVRKSNQQAINLYHNLGYHEVGIWTSYYQDREDALVFEKSLVR